MHDWTYVTTQGELILLQCANCGAVAVDSGSGCCDVARVDSPDELRALADAMADATGPFDAV